MTVITLDDGIVSILTLGGTFLAVIGLSALIIAVANRGEPSEPLSMRQKAVLGILAAAAVGLAMTGFGLSALAVLVTLPLVYLYEKREEWLWEKSVGLVAFFMVTIVSFSSIGPALLHDMSRHANSIIASTALMAALLALAYQAVPHRHRSVVAQYALGAQVTLVALWLAGFENLALALAVVIAAVLVIMPLLGDALSKNRSFLKLGVGAIGSICLAASASMGLTTISEAGHADYGNWAVADISNSVGHRVYGFEDHHSAAISTKLTGFAETATIDLIPFDQKVELVIYRKSPVLYPSSSMAILAESVRNIAAFMGDAEPFLTHQPVSLVFDYTLPTPSTAGSLYETWDRGSAEWEKTIVVRPHFDGDNEASGIIISHEVAHYFFADRNEHWLDEGAASFLSVISESHRAWRPLSPSHGPSKGCVSDEGPPLLRPQSGKQPSMCDYILGERLFLDLYTTLGHRAFQKAFRRVYSQYKDDKAGTELVRDAFTEGASPPARALIEEKIALWLRGSGLGWPAAPSTDFDTPLEALFLGYEPGQPVDRFSANRRDKQSRLFVEFSPGSASDHADEQESVVPVEVVEYSESYGYRVEEARRTVGWEPAVHGVQWHVPIGPGPEARWESGLYWADILLKGDTIGSAAWQVVD